MHPFSMSLFMYENTVSSINYRTLEKNILTPTERSGLVIGYLADSETLNFCSFTTGNYLV